MIEGWEMKLFSCISKHTPTSIQLQKFSTKPQLSSLRSPFGPGLRIWCSSSLDVHQHASLNMLHPNSVHSAYWIPAQCIDDPLEYQHYRLCLTSSQGSTSAVTKTLLFLISAQYSTMCESIQNLE